MIDRGKLHSHTNKSAFTYNNIIIICTMPCKFDAQILNFYTAISLNFRFFLISDIVYMKVITLINTVWPYSNEVSFYDDVMAYKLHKLARTCMSVV